MNFTYMSDTYVEEAVQRPLPQQEQQQPPRTSESNFDLRVGIYYFFNLPYPLSHPGSSYRGSLVKAEETSPASGRTTVTNTYGTSEVDSSNNISSPHIGARLGSSNGLMQWQLELLSSQPQASLAAKHNNIDGRSTSNITSTNTPRAVQVARTTPGQGSFGAQRMAPRRQTKEFNFFDVTRFFDDTEGATMPRELAHATKLYDSGDFDGEDAEAAVVVSAAATPPPQERLRATVDASVTSPPVRTMRSAHLSWGSKPRSPSLFSSEVTEEARRLDVRRVLSIIVVADARDDQRSLQARPPPLAPLAAYRETPELQPLEDAQSALSRTATARSSDNFEADELVKVSYKSGLTARHSHAIELARQHFLSGHNVMLLMGNTPRTTCLAEDLLSTIVTTVFDQAENMGLSVTNEIAISAHGMTPEDGHVINLLPRSTGEAVWEPMQLTANPIAGVVIGNHRPVYMWAEDQARYLSRGLIHNARALNVDPYGGGRGCNTLLWVTLLLKQTRSSAADISAADISASPDGGARPSSEDAGSGQTDDNGGNSPFVYLSTMHLVYSGFNLPMVDELIRRESVHVWPLFRPAFGGQCRTAVLALVDDVEGRARTQPLLSVATERSRTENPPPHSGSVQQFLQTINLTIAQSAGPPDQSSFAMRADAMRLLVDPGADIPFYESSGGSSAEPYGRAHQVLLLDPVEEEEDEEEVEGAGEEEAAADLQQRSASAPTSPTSPTVAASASNSGSGTGIGTGTGTDWGGRGSDVQTIRIQMPSMVRRRTVDAHRDMAVERERATQDGEHYPAMHLLPGSGGALKDSRQRGATTGGEGEGHGEEKESPVAVARSVPLPPTTATTTEAAPPAAGARRNRSESVVLLDSQQGSEWAAAVVERIDATHIAVLASNRRRSTGNANGSVGGAPDDTSATLDPSSFDMTSRTGRSDGSVRCRFLADDARLVQLTSTDGASAAAYELRMSALMAMPAVTGLLDSFVVDQRNSAILGSECIGGVGPFEAQPLWGAVRIILNEAMRAHQRSHAAGQPSTLTLFASLLRGRAVLRDLADPDSPDEWDGEAADVEVGMSPLFGPLLFRTRSVDLRTESDAGEVLAAMLRRADTTAGTSTEPYIVMTCIQKTTHRLTDEEASHVDREFGYDYDATFSSLTVISTRSSTKLYRDCVQRDARVFPTALLSDAVHGTTHTLCLLHADRTRADPKAVMDALLAHNLIVGARKRAPRSGRVRGYLEECLLGMARTERRLSRGAPSAGEEEQQQQNSLRERYDAFEAMAREHEVYLVDSEQQGYVLYPGNGNGPSVVDTNAATITRDTASDGQLGGGGGSEDSRSRSVPLHQQAPVAYRATAAAAASGGGASSMPSIMHTTSDSLITLDLPPVVEETRVRYAASSEVSPYPGAANAVINSTGNSNGKKVHTAPSSASVSPAHRASREARVATSVSGRPARPASASTGAPGESTDRPPWPLSRATARHMPPAATSGLAAAAADAEERDGVLRRSVETAATRPLRPLTPSPMAVSPESAHAAAGVVVHSMLVLAHTNGSSGSGGGAEVMRLSSAKRGELRVSSQARDLDQLLHFDEIVELSPSPSSGGGVAGPASTSAATTPAVTPAVPAGNALSISRSATLQQAIGGFLGSSNSAIVMQATAAAEEARVVDGVLMRVVRSCLANKPPEVEFFLSVCLVPSSVRTAVDLLAVDSARPAASDEAPLRLGFSPLTGPFIMTPRLVPVHTIEESAEAVATALEADDRLGSRYGPHLLVLSLMQKTVVAAERDVSVSSLLVVLGRRSPFAVKAISSRDPLAPLMRYALGGPCFTVCCSAVTDAEPDYPAAAHPAGGAADAMLVYQLGTLCGVAGKPIIYNSYVDLLKHHRQRYAEFKVQYKAARAKLERDGEGGDSACTALLEQRLRALAKSMDRMASMINDEERVLVGAGLPGQPPPFYTL